MCSHVTCIIDRGRANERIPRSPTHTIHIQYTHRASGLFSDSTHVPTVLRRRALCHTYRAHTHTTHTATPSQGPRGIQVQSPACTRSALHFNAPLTAVREKEIHSHSRESLIRPNSPVLRTHEVHTTLEVCTPSIRPGLKDKAEAPKSRRTDKKSQRLNQRQNINAGKESRHLSGQRRLITRRTKPTSRKAT